MAVSRLERQPLSPSEVSQKCIVVQGIHFISYMQVSYQQQDPVEYYNQPLQIEEQQQNTHEDLYSVVNEGSRHKDPPSISSTPPVDT